jgi:hypothetical protein
VVQLVCSPDTCVRNHSHLHLLPSLVGRAFQPGIGQAEIPLARETAPQELREGKLALS